LSQSNLIETKKRKPGKTTAFFICLFVAAFLWLVRSLNTIYTYNLKIPVSFKNVPQNKKTLHSLPEYLNVDIKASGLKLFFILANRPLKAIDIDFNNLKTSNKQQNYILSPSTVNFKNSLRLDAVIKQISPDTIYFIEKSGFQKNVPVKVPLEIKCLPGYGYKTPEVYPTFVTLVGDTSQLKGIDTIYTQPLYLNNLSENVDKKISLIKPAERIYTGINEINVKVTVDRLIEQFVELPVSYLNVDPDVKSINIFPSKVKVKYTVLQNNFNNSDTALFKATINPSRINKTTNKAPVTLTTVPGNINILGIVPPDVEILIIKK